MSSCHCTTTDNHYPLKAATTQRFRMGAPRSFVVSANGNKVAFVRSDSGTSAVLNIWVVENLDTQPQERCVVRASDLLKDDETLSPAERARRERLREGGAGITGFSADAALSTLCFALSGNLFVVEVASGKATQIGDYAAVVDPRLNSDCTKIAFTTGTDFVVFDLATNKEIIHLAAESDTVSYGLADFIAAEELDRHRGHWWSTDGTKIVVERNDEKDVEIRWISDPTYPAHEARPHRYPAAGTNNSEVSLILVDVETGAQTPLSWDTAAFEYLVSVTWTKTSPLVTVLNRAQNQQITYVFDGAVASVATQATDDCWVDCGIGVPAALNTGELLTAKDDSAARSLYIGEKKISDRHVSHVVSHDDDGVIAAVFNQPWELEIVRYNFDGHTTSLSDPHGYAMAAADANLAVVVQTNASDIRAHYYIKRDTEIIFEIASNVENIDLKFDVEIGTVTDRKLPYAIMWPENHVRGSHKLPIVVSIYGGPHAAVVIANKKAFADDQWLANQGYAVISIDNAGSPGRSPAWEREVFGNLTDPVLADQVAGLQALLAKFPDDLDGSRVGIHGWSFGGYLSALAVLDRPDVYAAAWAGAPAIDWNLYDTGYTERYLGTPQNNPENYANGSLTNKAHKLSRPLTLIHGMSDDNVLAAHSLQLSGALLAAGKPHNFLPLAGVSHMTPQASVTQNLMLLMRDFFDKELKVQR